MLSESSPTVLVTGASGFVGLNVVELLLSSGHEVLAVSHDEFPPAAFAEFSGLDGSLTATVADVRNVETISEMASSADIVIHGAAITVSDDHEQVTGDRMLDVNIGGTRALLEAARLGIGVDRVVYVSSGAVYGDATFGVEPVTEDTPAHPTSLYGLSKLTSELLVKQHGALYDVATVSARLSAVFGPWERDTGVRDSLSPMYRMAVAAQRGEAMRMGRFAPRNWLYARDAARAITHLAVGPAPQHHLYNVTPTEWCDPGEWANQLLERNPYLDSTQPNESAQRFDGEPGRRRAPVDNSRLRSELPDWPLFSPSEAFADYLAWLERHPGVM